MPEIVVVEGLSKKFRIQKSRAFTLKDLLVRCFSVRYERGNKYIWVLSDINFSLEQGRTLGIIGHNGAGKSTLLRLICGLGRPTAGKIRLHGNVGSLLELGTGFHRDMTGRENLVTGGILSGLTRRQVRGKEEEIVAFAELEEYIDQPVRTYSTGMYMRLAFASAIHFEPDFLVVDEVLAVGDSRFQQKCLERMRSYKDAGKSLIIVSHNLEQVRELCDEVLVLEEGRAVMQGDAEDAFNCYYDLMRQRTEKRAERLGMEAKADPPTEHGSRLGTQEVTIGTVRINDKVGNVVDSLLADGAISISIEYILNRPVTDFALILGIFSATNAKCFEVSIPSVRAHFGHLSETGVIKCELPRVPLLPGDYYINIALYPTDWSYHYDYHWQMHPIRVDSLQEGLSLAHTSGIVLIAPAWSHEVRK